MPENKESRPRSFRIDDETAEKFREISAKLGDRANKASQQETLAKLIESYEFQAGKAILTDKRADIEQFEKYISCLTNMYMGSLEDNQNITETVRTEFEALLQSKDATIQDLQSQLATAKQLKEESTSKAKMYADENLRLNNLLESREKEYDSKMDDMQAMMSDKDSLNKALTDSCNGLKIKAERMAEAAEQTETLRSALSQLEKEHDQIVKECIDLKNQLQQAQVNHEDALDRAREQAQIDLDKAVLQIEKSYQKQIQDLKASNQAEIDKYQKKYLSLLEQMQRQADASLYLSGGT